MFAAIAALLGAVIGGASTFLGTWHAQRRSRQAQVAETKKEIYADLLNHLDKLRDRSFDDSAAVNAYTEEMDGTPDARRTTWFVRMEMFAPSRIRELADEMIESAVALGEARAGHTAVHGNEIVVHEAHPEVLAAHVMVGKAREKLMAAIRSDLKLTG